MPNFDLALDDFYSKVCFCACLSSLAVLPTVFSTDRILHRLVKFRTAVSKRSVTIWDCSPKKLRESQYYNPQ